VWDSHRFEMNYNGNARVSTPITMLVDPNKLQKPANQMPDVSALWLLNRGLYIVKFEIDGYFSTAEGIKYLQDVQARFIQTYGEDAVKPAVPPKREPDYEREVILHLKEFAANLDSLKRKVANTVPLQKVLANDFDETFWAMKLWMERQLSQNRIPSECELESIGSTYAPHKERSTIRAKARSIYRWYALRDFEPTRDARTAKERKIEDRLRYLLRTGKTEDEIMTRQEAAKVATQTRMARVQAKIEQAINLLKMENKKITVRAVADFAQISTKTAQKYLKELRLKGVI